MYLLSSECNSCDVILKELSTTVCSQKEMCCGKAVRHNLIRGQTPHPLSQCQDSYAAITPPFREAPLKKSCSQFGRCPSSDCVPPAPTQPGTLGHFIFELTSILTHKKACNSKRLFQLPQHDENQSKYHNRRNLGSSQAQNGL